MIRVELGRACEEGREREGGGRLGGWGRRVGGWGKRREGCRGVRRWDEDRRGGERCWRWCANEEGREGRESGVKETRVGDEVGGEGEDERFLGEDDLRAGRNERDDRGQPAHSRRDVRERNERVTCSDGKVDDNDGIVTEKEVKEELNDGERVDVVREEGEKPREGEEGERGSPARERNEARISLDIESEKLDTEAY